PACAPLARAFHAQLAQAHTDRIDVVRRHRAGREQCHLAPRALLLHLDGLAPRFALARVDLAQVEHLTLRHAPIGKTPILDKVPVLVDLAVLHASAAAQEHVAALYEAPRRVASTKVFTTSVWQSLP